MQFKSESLNKSISDLDARLKIKEKEFLESESQLKIFNDERFKLFGEKLIVQVEQELEEKELILIRNEKDSALKINNLKKDIELLNLEIENNRKRSLELSNKLELLKIDSSVDLDLLLVQREEEISAKFSLINSLNQDLGVIKEKLETNVQAKESLKEKLSLLELQKVELERFSLLHDLIGSSDGKKFRNFAQGLSFDIMIAQANKQLIKMTDRYLLIRDEKNSLALNILDNYQAGEIRSTKNLSGERVLLLVLL